MYYTWLLIFGFGFSNLRSQSQISRGHVQYTLAVGALFWGFGCVYDVNYTFTSSLRDALNFDCTNQSNFCEEPSSPNAFSASPSRVGSDPHLYIKITMQPKEASFYIR